MTGTLHDYGERNGAAVNQRFDIPLRVIARRTVRVWFNHGRLDRVLSENFGVCPFCELLYAIDVEGRQISSNVRPGSIDPEAFGQDLSGRPYSVSLSVLNNAAFQGAFLCDTYISKVTRRPCVTVMHGVTSGQSILGFIAADLDPARLMRPPYEKQAARRPHYGLRPEPGHRIRSTDTR